MSDKAEDLFKRIHKHKGVEGIIICDGQGIPAKSTITDEDKTLIYTTGVVQYLNKCSDKIKVLVNEEIKMLRIRTKNEEILVTPKRDLILIIIQKPLANN